MAADPPALTRFGFVRRNLTRQPVRTSLTVIGVGLGVVAIVALNTTVRGLWSSMEVAIKTGGADMMIYQQGVAADIFSSLPEQQTRQTVLSDPGVAETASGLFHVMPVDDAPFMLLFGVRRGEFVLESDPTIEGRRPAAENEVMLGRTAARQLDKGVGQTVRLGGEPFDVVGIFETDVPFFNGGLLILLPKLQQMLDRPDQVTALMVKLNPGADLTATRQRIEAELPNVVTITNAAEYARVDKGLEIGQGMVWAISALAIFVGAIIVANTMWMAVYERTREIGILRALGWKRGSIVVMVLAEAVGVGLLACVFGCVLGVALAELSTLLPVTSQFNRPVYDLPPFLLALGVAVTLSLAGAIAPAWRATQITPAEALRYE